VAARAAPLLEFAFGDRQRAHSCDRPLIRMASTSTLVGLQTYRRIQLEITGNLEHFVVFFQPSGVNRLFSIPMNDLTNEDFDARSVLGPWISEAEQRLAAARTFEERAGIMDRILLNRARGLDRDGLASSANDILRRGGRISIPASANLAGMSVRQFERRFMQQIGMRPKLYARIARFEAALNRKARSPLRTWTDIAQEFGYHDQMHLVHDFREFTSESPTTTLVQIETFHDANLAAARLSRNRLGDRDRADDEATLFL
jgi:AraC-like DNA-binding protein